MHSAITKIYRPISGGIFQKSFILLAFLALALLVSNTAAGLACRLAGSLALAASAVLCALAKVLSLNSLNVLHFIDLR